MNEREIEDRLRRLGEGGRPPGEPVAFAGVRDRVEQRHRRRAVGVAAAAALAVAAPLGWAAIAGTSGAPADTATVERPACPEETPLRESGGLDAPSSTTGEASRLVPDGEVVAVTVCRYEAGRLGSQSPTELVGARSLDGDLDAVVADLREVSPMADVDRGGCDIGSAQTPYLARIDYPDGHAWVAAGDDDSCGYHRWQSTNGVEDFDHVGRQLAQAYADRAWPGLRGQGCKRPAALRRGLRTHVLSGDEPVSAVVCSTIRPGDAEPVEDLPALMAALRSATAGQPPSDRLVDPSPAECPATAQVVVEWLRLRYETGPDVEVQITPACSPQVATAAGDFDLTPELGEILGIDVD